MLVEPVATVLTTPELVIVATPIAEETHGVEDAGVPEPDNVIVLVVHKLVAPEITGSGLITTATVLLFTELLQGVGLVTLQ